MSNSRPRARRRANYLLSEFPFADDGRSKAVAVSAIIGLFGAQLRFRSQRPVFIYLGNAEGAGKTLLEMRDLADAWTRQYQRRSQRQDRNFERTLGGSDGGLPLYPVR